MRSLASPPKPASPSRFVVEPAASDATNVPWPFVSRTSAVSLRTSYVLGFLAATSGAWRSAGGAGGEQEPAAKGGGAPGGRGGGAERPGVGSARGRPPAVRHAASARMGLGSPLWASEPLSRVVPSSSWLRPDRGVRM